jgi:uncharacterized protein YrrD
VIKASDLDGRAVVDLESARKIGHIDEIYLDTDGGSIAAYRVSEGSALTGGNKIVMPASAVETIGPEAIMVRPIDASRLEHESFDRLPRLSHIKGRKVVSEGGKLLGTIDDVMMDDASGRIHGYTLKSASWTESLFGGDDDHADYVRGDAQLRLGEDLMIVPEDAVVRGAVRHDDDDASSIESLSSSTRPATRSRVTPAQPAGVEYAEPLDRTEPVGHTEPIGHAGRTVRFEPSEPVSHTEPLARTEPVARTERTEHWDDVRTRYRSRWEQRTAGRGGLWEEHEPGYRYGWEMASRPEYRTRSWSTAEPELRQDWEHRHHDRPWDRVVDAIRDAWDDVTGRDETDVAGYRSTRDHDDAPGAIERLQARPMPTRERPLTETEPLGTHRITDESPDSRRSLL